MLEFGNRPTTLEVEIGKIKKGFELGEKVKFSSAEKLLKL